MKVYQYTVGKEQAGARIDKFLTEVYVLTGDFRDGDREAVLKFLVNPVESREASLAPAETLDLPYEEPKALELVPQNIALSILYEDEYMIVLNKARGMVCHPGPGNPDGTLVNALLYHVGPSLFEAATRPDRASYTGWIKTPPALWWQQKHRRPIAFCRKRSALTVRSGGM